VIKKFQKHGFSEDQAEVIVETINDQNTQLVTKNDLKLSVTELKSEISKLENKMDINMKWIMAIGIIIIGMLLKNTFI
jgi:hypothetical protein